MDAVAETKFFFKMEWLVLALDMFVTNDIVGACDNAPGTTSAQASRDDLFVEFLPLRGPTLGFGRSTRHGHLTRLGRYPHRRHTHKDMEKARLHD